MTADPNESLKRLFLKSGTVGGEQPKDPRLEQMRHLVAHRRFLANEGLKNRLQNAWESLRRVATERAGGDLSIRSAGLPGLSGDVLNQLEANGIETAADVARIGVRHVYGVGQKRATLLEAWAHSEVARLAQRLPDRLPREIEAKIRREVDDEVAQLDAQISELRDTRDSG
jgi:DNA-binding helix-hairpin-helix protein with protein kinase domain